MPSRRPILGLLSALALPIAAGCTDLRERVSTGSEPAVDGQLGASGVTLHNLADEPVTASVQVVEADDGESTSIDESVQIGSPGSHRIYGNVPNETAYRVTVSVGSSPVDETRWTPTREYEAGLHILYDGTDRVVFASGFYGE